MGDVAEISLKVPSTSIVVEETAAVYAARLAQLAARRAKKGAKTVSSAPVANRSEITPLTSSTSGPLNKG